MTTNDSITSNRQPRNFLSSPANSIFNKRNVAFDAYRNKPFEQEQATITYDGTLGRDDLQFSTFLNKNPAKSDSSKSVKVYSI